MKQESNITKDDNYELVSDEIRDVLNYKPHWIVQNGNTLFFIVLTSLFSLTFFINYPDIIKGNSRIVSLNPPKPITSKQEGRLIRLFIRNDQYVQNGEHLGYLESTANYDEVITIFDWVKYAISETQSSKYDVLITKPMPVLSNLGELQLNYQEFQNIVNDLKQTMSSGYYQLKKNALQEDLIAISKLKSNAYKQLELMDGDLKLQQKEYDAYETLAKEKVIAPLELNQYKSKILTKKQSLSNNENQITNANLNYLNKKKELLDLSKHISDQQQLFQSQLYEFKSQIEKWLKQFVITASESGNVHFVSTLHENDIVSPGQLLFFIQPLKSQFYSEVMISQEGFGKVKLNQKVILRVQSFPSNEFGYLSGVVKYISEIPNRHDSVLLNVEFINGLRTNFGRELEFRNGLLAQAEIITKKRRLIERLVGEIRKIFD